ncbi:MAG: hypothetical protein OXC99_01520 [Chloroflexi bacterium]|nr:hypothetical protein [Chloroflexota bacterium]
MRRIPIPAAAALAVLLFLGFTAGYLFRELDQANVDLRETRSALVQSNTDLVASIETHNALAADFDTLAKQRNALVAERDALARGLAQVGTERDGLRIEVHELSEENRTLAHEKTVLTQEYDHLKSAHEQLADANRQLGARHEALQVVHQDLQASHQTLQGSHQELQGSYEELQVSHQTLNTRYAGLDAEHTALTKAAGTVETLETQAGNLRTEIAQLEERRRPLILSQQSERVLGLLCTGSMEPKLTCLDTATWLHDFQPENIVIGATISFQSRACWSDEPSNSNTAHRVMDIKVSGGVHFYWPQGDANSGPDGCWVPHTAVNGYIIEVHKNTRPANATLRNNVNAAKSTYVTARDAYQDLRQAHGCHRNIGICTVYSDAAYNTLNQAYQRYLEAYNSYDCWYRNAEDSQYPGHISYAC